MDAIFFRTHKVNKRIIKNIQALSNLAPNVFVIYDSTDREHFPDIGLPVFEFTKDDYDKSGFPIATLEQIYELPTAPPLGNKSATIYFNPEYAQLLAMKWLDDQGKKYDNYWYYEYDVVFNGNIRHFFSLCAKNKADLLTTMLRQFPFEPTFKKFYNMLSFDVEAQQQFAMFGPLWRASRKLMETLDREYRAGKHGYYETVVPTLAVLNDMVIADINNCGMLYNPLTFNGQGIRKRWAQGFVNNMKNMLFHPIPNPDTAFLFATGYIGDDEDTEKYLKWIEYYWKKKDNLGIENLVVIDDGSKTAKVNMLKYKTEKKNIPFEIFDAELLPEELQAGVNWIRFSENLGRPSIHCTPGWHRSFSFAAVLAEHYNYDKIIHVEADTFVMTDRLFRYLYDTIRGWNVLYSLKYEFPDTTIQVIGKDKYGDMRLMYDLGQKFWFKAESNKWFIAEFVLKFSSVVKYFQGGRYDIDPFLKRNNGVDYMSAFTLDERQKMEQTFLGENQDESKKIYKTNGKKIADIIIPHHDKHDLLKNCVSKIDHELFNVIVTSGGSFAENCNKGAKAAQTDTLLFLNDDVIPNNQILAEVVEHGSDYTGCAQYVPSEGVVKYGIAYNMKDGKAQGYLALRPEDCLMPTGFCFKIRKSLWDKLGGFDERFRNGAEDQDLGFRALEDGVKFGYVLKPMRHLHSQSTGRFDHTKENNKLLNQIWTDEKIYKLIQQQTIPMKILVANHHLSEYAGSETFTLTLYNALQGMGHRVDLYSYTKRNTMIAETIDEPKDEYDLILLSHNTCMEKFRHYRGVKICTVHGTTPRLEQPRLGADIYVTISEEVREWLERKGFRSHLIYNGVDRNRFKPVSPLNKRLTNVLSLCKTEEANTILKKACSKLGVNFRAINNQGNVEDYINEADLVVSLGRGIYEAMSCGKTTLVFDERRYQAAYADGYLTKSNIEESLKYNFSGRRYKKVLNEEGIIKELSKYKASDGEVNYKHSKMFDSITQAEQYLRLYQYYISKKSDFEFIDSSTTDYGIAKQLQRQLKAMGYKEGGGKTMCYGNDMGKITIKQEPATIQNSSTLRRYAKSKADLKFKSQNIDIDGIYLPSAVDKNIFNDKQLNRDVDISFVSKISNDKRREFVQVMRQTFPQTIVQSDIYFGDMAKLYNRSKIVANHSVVKEVNMRMFEATSCGALLITEYVEDLPGLWEIGKEIITYKSYDEMIALIQYYLKHNNEREVIAKAGQMRTLSEHTYANRCKEIINLL